MHSFNWNKAWNINKVIKTTLKSRPVWSVKSFHATRIRKNYIRINWGKSSKTSGYEVYVNGKKRKTTSSRGYTITGLKRKTKYMIHVIPYHKVNSKKYYGTSKRISVTTRKY